MHPIKIKYEGNLRCVVTDPVNNQNVTTDGPVAQGGREEYMSPTDLFAISLATCMATMMGMQANASKIDLSGMTMEVTKAFSAGKPMRVGAIVIVFEMPKGIDEHHQELLKKSTLGCPIHNSLHPDMAIDTKYIW